MKEKNTLALINKYRGCIMGFAALWIWFFHEWSPIMEGHWKAYAVETYLSRIGFCGVDFFLLLSGMGMLYASEKYNLFTFYRRRIARVFLPLALIAVLMAFYQEWTLVTFCHNLFGINFYAESMYSFMWYGPAILTLYLLFPLYYFLFQKASDKSVFTAGALLLWLLISVYVIGILREDLYGFVNRIPIFLMGVLVGWLAKNREIVFTKLTWGVCVIMLITGLYFAYITGYNGFFLVVPVSDACIPNILIALSGTCLLAKGFSLLDTHLSVVGKGINRIFAFFGMFSFEFYLMQSWIVKDFLYDWASQYGPLFLNVCVLVGEILCGLLLYGICKLIVKGFGFLCNRIKPFQK